MSFALETGAYIAVVAKPVANLRLFVAAYPPVEIARAMLDALAAIDVPDHRKTSVEQLHLTLQFIGDTPAAQMDTVVESMERSASGVGSFTLTPIKLISLPERGPARLIAAETDAPTALLELQRRLASRLARNVRPKPGDQYRPHLTLCRFRSPVAKFKMAQQLAVNSFIVRRICLMRSTLSASGAMHVEISHICLG